MDQVDAMVNPREAVVPLESDSPRRAVILGCGYVGQAIAQRWRAQGMDVTVTTRTPERVEALRSLADNVVVVQGKDKAALSSLLANTQVLLVSVAAKGGSYEEAYLETAQALAQVTPTLSHLEQLLYTSSCSVYGDHQGAWVTEASAIAPKGANQKVLAEAEQVFLDLRTATLPVAILRLGGIYGPGRELERIFQRVPGTLRPGDGQEPSNWIHLHDIVGAIALVQQQHLSGIYNVVNDVPITSYDLLTQLCQRQGWDPVQWDATQTSPKNYNARVSNQKLKAEGFSCIYPSLF